MRRCGAATRTARSVDPAGPIVPTLPSLSVGLRRDTAGAAAEQPDRAGHAPTARRPSSTPARRPGMEAGAVEHLRPRRRAPDRRRPGHDEAAQRPRRRLHEEHLLGRVVRAPGGLAFATIGAVTRPPSASARWLALGVVCLGVLMAVLDVTIVNVALPSIRADLGFSEADAGLGRQRLHAHLRRLPAARRAARRPLRAAAPVHDRHRPVQPRLARLRPGERAAAAGHRPGGPGHRRRDRRGGRAGVADEPLHRAGRARQGDGRLRLRLRQRRQHRRAPRRRPHRRLRLALDLPRQPADRPGGARPQPGGAAGDEGRRAAAAARRRRRRDGDGGAAARGLRDRRRQRDRLDRAADAGAARLPRRCCSRSSSPSRRSWPSR